MFFSQQQIPPHILKTMHIANTDPLVNAFCRSRGIHDANVLYHQLLEFGKQRYVNNLKALDKSEVERLAVENALDPEMWPDPEPTPLRCNHGADLDFDAFHVVLEGGSRRYQCRCGAVSVDPLNEIPKDSGHRNMWDGAGTSIQDVEPLERKTCLVIKSPLIETAVVEVVDGIPVYGEQNA
jgi:hypothetical protein